MYAVVVVDHRCGRVVLVRDQFGIKPLYYSTPPGRLVVGSEIKTLFTHPEVRRAVDWAAALSSQALTGEPQLDRSPPISWFTDVQVVPAGTVTAFSLHDGRRTQQDVRSLMPEFSDLVTEDDFVAAFGELLRGSVQDCATSDADVGLFLSHPADWCDKESSRCLIQC